VYRRRHAVEPGTVHRGRIPGRRAAAAGDGVRRRRRGGGGGRRRPRRADRQPASAGGPLGRGAGAGPAQSRVAVPRPLAVDSIRQPATGRVPRTGIERVAGRAGRTGLLRAPRDRVPGHTAAGQGTGIRRQLAVLRLPVRRRGVPVRVLRALTEQRLLCRAGPTTSTAVLYRTTG